MAAAAGQNMLLAFHEMGFGGIWRTGKFSFNREISMELDLKENEIVIGYLYIGTIEGKLKNSELIRRFCYQMGIKLIVKIIYILLEILHQLFRHSVPTPSITYNFELEIPLER